MTMTFRQFAFNNVLRNKRLYIAYFLSSLFTVMVFFTFANFAFHPALSGEDLNKHVITGMTVAGGIIYVFSFFFVLYSMSAFLRSRKKEFGVLMIQGMSDNQVRWMVFLENMLIGFFSTVFGILFGLVFSKGILLIAENVLVLDQALGFYFPVNAIVITFISFIVLFFIISIFVTVVLRTNKLVQLMKGDKIEKGEPKANIWLTLLAVILLGSGYAIALVVEGVQVVVALIPVVFLVTLGTYLLFSQLSVYIIRKLKGNKSLFWKKTNMLLFSDLSYRMKDNARAFFMVAIISTVAFSAIGTLVGFHSLLTSSIKKSNPMSFTYYVDEESGQEDITFVEDTLAKYDVDYEKVTIEIPYYEQSDLQEPVAIVTPEIYNTYAQLQDEEELVLAVDEVITVGQSDANMMVEQPLDKHPIQLKDGTNVEVHAKGNVTAKRNVLPIMAAHYIVGEDVFAQLPDPVDIERQVAWHAKNATNDELIAVGQELDEAGLYAVIAIDYTVYEVTKIWSPILFVGLFIGIVFFVSAGSFLYFRLYADLDDDKQKFKAISKIGLTTSEMSKVISKQVAILFFAPIIVALIHGAVALTALSHLFTSSLVKEASYVLGSFFVIQVMYFFVVRYFYVKQIKHAIK